LQLLYAILHFILPTHTEKGFFMLTARASSRTDLEHLTQSIHVIDALEESENADWKEIILLGFQNDQSDLLNFETLCHSTGRQMLTDATRTYTFETGLDSTKIKFVATQHGDCRVTEAELAMTSANSLLPRKFGITLFMFCSTMDAPQLTADEDRVVKLLDVLYQRHQQNPIPVYFIGNVKPEYFNIPLLFSERDKLKPVPALAIQPESSNARITQQLTESKAIPSNQPELPSAPQHDVITDTNRVAPHRRPVYHTSYAHSRPHRFPRAPLKPSINRHRDTDEQFQQQTNNRASKL
jgi:hypothetical protein